MSGRNYEKQYHARDREVWRRWLRENCDREEHVWLIIYKKKSGVDSVSYSEAVDEALCFGWVDSLPNKRDEQSYYQYFARRKPKSNWSRVNKQKVERLLREGRMEAPGLVAVERARQDGSWDALNEVEELRIPEDLQLALEAIPQAASHFEAFPRSVKRGILEWILNAKREETRAKRIADTARLAGENIRANQYRQSGVGNKGVT